ncbi:oxidoreductase family protein [Flammeovirga sp. SubArs3]|uniref:oxidoreductase family protein n=1 Tax=Flammeovirga sp. SubArs3 TaxID=2995316 RepID=UPI00248AF293|nr:oxidoreductase family protein [Flammeovirga sp. SubArs3]
MEKEIEKFILQETKAERINDKIMIQSLWSGYGSIVRYSLDGYKQKSIIVKHVQLGAQGDHPRGWNTDISHQRKLKSYQVETYFYKNYSHLTNDNCRIPDCLGITFIGDDVVILLEDLDEVGFDRRVSEITWEEINACLSWLANFHAVYLQKEPKGLWEIGTYWHLATRPDELEALDDIPLKNLAQVIDQRLNNAKYKTFVHGDAKVANFCFDKEGNKVAAVDFQYIGGGCGMKDLAYFIGSCLHEEDCEKYEDIILETYFNYLKDAIQENHIDINPEEVEEEWRTLFPIAWTDFHRFLKGWSPGHWKINSYSEKMSKLVVEALS